MNNFKTIFFFLALVFSFTTLNAQSENKEVTITASGSGKTLEDAKQAALRSATEQAFGAFISSKTEMFNDKVVADQMASVSSGNIKSFSILNESQLPDGRWGVTLKSLVSVDKLTSFVEAKGIAIEIKGSMFALNIKQQLLNEQGEIKAVSEMVGLLHEPMQISFDYAIKSSEPKSLDTESKNWEIPLIVTATTNKNIDFCANYCIKTLAALSLSSEEVRSYQSLNKVIFPVLINYNGVAKTFYLRKQRSINALNTLTSQWEFYTRLFSVQSGMDEMNGFYFENESRYFFGGENSHDTMEINFLTTGQKAVSFLLQDKRTLAQIEQMTGYKVKPLGIISQIKHGGFVVYEVPPGYRIGLQTKQNSNEILLLTTGGIAENSGLISGDKIISINDIEVVNGNISEIINKSEKTNKLCQFKVDRAGKILITDIYPAWVEGHGLVVGISDLGLMNWNDAKSACEELVLNGYSDWRLPTKEEIKKIYKNLLPKGIGGIHGTYWSTETTEYDTVMRYNLIKNSLGGGDASKSDLSNVRAVRTF